MVNDTSQMKGLKAAVLCGGEGRRLRPLTYYFQKVMIPIGSRQKPLLEFIIRLLRYHGIRDVVLLAGYRHEQVVNYFNDGSRFGVTITYVHDDPEFKGNGGAVLNALRQGVVDPGETLLVYYGDILSNINLSEMIKKHRSSGVEVTLATVRGYQLPVGLVEADGEGRILRLVEKPKMDFLIGIGIMLLEGEALQILEDIGGRKKTVDLMSDLLPEVRNRGRPVHTYSTDCFWYDVGSIERFEKMDNKDVDKYLASIMSYPKGTRI